MSFRIS